MNIPFDLAIPFLTNCSKKTLNKCSKMYKMISLVLLIIAKLAKYLKTMMLEGWLKSSLLPGRYGSVVDPGTRRSLVPFPVKAHVLVGGSIPVATMQETANQ